MTDVISIVEGLDFAVSLAGPHVHPEDIDVARAVADEARSRAGHLGDTLVLALVGGTGSGKSSLLNALAGERVASVSAVRPHTTEPLAWIPQDAEPSLRMLLDRLGITRRVDQQVFEHLAVLDMADVDSVATEHRTQVERLLPDVDVVVWVLDPVKYADPMLHRDFIAPLAASSDRLVFVLNQVDRLDDEGLTSVHRDLLRLLHEDGIADPIVFRTAADPPHGQQRGIESLAVHLGARLDEKRIQIGRLIDDVRTAATTIAGAAGVTAGGSLEFEQRWQAVRAAIIAETLASGGAAGGIEEALRLLESLVVRLSTEAGGGFGLRIRQTFRTEAVEQDLRSIVDAARVAADPAATVDEGLQERFGAPIREILWERASLSAVIAGLAVDTTAVDTGLGRTS